MSKNDETPPMQEQVQQIPISELHPFEGHPFRVVDDEAMTQTVESISQFGVISPLLARPDPDGGYEIISGHRRCHAAEQVGLETLPVIVREMDDDEAIIAMVDANLQRETILPSERAWAYKMKMDAIKHQGARTDLTSRPVVGKLEAADQIGKDAGESGRQVQRYIRLTNLVPELMDMVDEGKIAFRPAVELSYLTRDEQSQLLEAMDYAQATPSLSQAQRLKKLSQLKQCSPEAMEILMDEVKKEELAPTVTLPTELLRKYFPKSYTPKQMEDTIIRLLDQWQKSWQRKQSR
ncbi:MAG: ParB/RepB/Spo0J family partition protein [Lachnospiraceae bacterium]|nr:ParB/RepB/Spo0J family partition protein [Lachnospiraceae bacterium]